MSFFIKQLTSTSDIRAESVVKLYQQLTKCPTISDSQLREFLSSLNDSHRIYVMLDKNEPIGLGTLLIERKLIRGISKVGHIEDIVISKNYRNQGLGKKMIDFLVQSAKEDGCYKVLLNCAAYNIGFYEKCGFKHKNVEMSYYFDE